MRNAFASTLTKLALEDPRIVLLSGDIGNKLFDSFKDRCPSRFFNCGVAEANMTTMAAGMALCGLRPVTYTIASFVTVRCLEQIRIDVCYHNLPVIIVGVGAGQILANRRPTAGRGFRNEAGIYPSPPWRQSRGHRRRPRGCAAATRRSMKAWDMPW